MKNYHLHLRGFVGGYDFDSRHVQNVLTANKNKPVDVLIDSLGGSVATALTIASAFRDHGDVHVHFVGMNASAATIASMGAKTISMDSSAMYLVHKCSSEFFQWASLNADQLEQQIADLTQMKTDLEKIDLNVATMYAKRCGKERDALLDLMKIGGWLNATEAKDWGFVDTITDDDEDAAPVLTDSIASAMAAVGMPIPNMPVQSSSKLQEFLAAMAEFFKGGAKEATANANQPNQTEITMKKFPFLAAVLLLADAQLTLADGKFPTDETQLSLIENALKEASEKAQALTDAEARAAAAAEKLAEAQSQLATANANLATANARIEELGKQPGDTTQQVHNNVGSQDPQPQKTDVEQFFDTNHSARELFAMLP